MNKYLYGCMLCFLCCIEPRYDTRVYFCYENLKICVSKSLLVKLFPEYIPDSIGDNVTALFNDYKTWRGQYVLVQREDKCWEVVDFYPFTQPVKQSLLFSNDSLVIWYDIYPGHTITRSYMVTEETITPY